MDWLIIALRLIHILAGVFWAGTSFFFVSFLQPAAQRAGPEGNKFMQVLGASRLSPVLSVLALLNVLSGLIMYWRNSGGLQAAWITSGMGLGFTVGALAGLVALGFGLIVARPANVRMGALGKEIQAAGGPPTPAQMAEIQRLSATLSTGSFWTVVCLLIALIGMSVARYLFF